MEVLAPAGNMKQAIAAINSGCDALYGGLKQWSARNRAENFTLDEYKSLLDICHLKNVKFYLTLNILFKDEELNSVIDLFQNPKFVFPDAVIVSDVGLMKTLKDFFPTLVIHASTQFGTSTIEDLRILESLDVSRTILSRELTIKEIESLCRNTSMEIEAFVYGSQCLAFSGQCLWGGILHGCSGNRGKCIGMCRDLYYRENNHDVVGQFLYPRDINATNILKELETIGIDSIKIEGRMRSAEETAYIVSSIKNSIDTSDGYVGYLSDCLPVKKMFSEVNKRTKSCAVNSSKLSCHDLCIENHDGKLLYCNGDKNSTCGSQEFVKCIYSNPLEPNQTNISMRLITSNNRALKVDYINTFGERKIFELCLDCDASSMYTIDSIYKFITDNIKENIYEFVSNSPSLEKIYIDLGELRTILDEISTKYCREQPSRNFDTIFTMMHDDFIQSKHIRTIIAFKEKGFKNFIYDITEVDELEKAIEIFKGDSHIIYKLPCVDFGSEHNRFFSLLKNKRIMISKTSHVVNLRNVSFCSPEVIGSYSLNVFNQATASFFKSNGITSMVYHPELSYEKNAEVYHNIFDENYVIAYGKIPLATTRACFSEVGLCSNNCKGNFNVSNSARGYSLKIDCASDLGIRSIIANKIIGNSVLQDDKNNIKRIVLIDYLNNSIIESLLSLKPVKYDIELYGRSVN